MRFQQVAGVLLITGQEYSCRDELETCTVDVGLEEQKLLETTPETQFVELERLLPGIK